MVDEDISRRTITLSIRTGKLTARTLAWALRAAGRKIQKERQAHKTPHGRQTVKQLMKQGAAYPHSGADEAGRGAAAAAAPKGTGKGGGA